MFYKNHRSPLSKLRQPHGLPTTASPDWSGDEYADLLSRDKNKMKDAIKRYLSSKVRNDWTFTWPPPVDANAESNSPPANAPAADPVPESLDSSEAAPVQDEPNDDAGYQVDDDSEGEDSYSNAAEDEDAQSIYSLVSLDPALHRIREDWDSDIPTDEPMPYGHRRSTSGGLPDATLSKDEQRASKRRDLRKEMEWNEGLACFEARRNAWTQARLARVRPKPETPQAASSPRSRRFFFRRSISSTASSQGARSRSGSVGTGLAPETSPTRETDKESCKQQDKASTSSASADSAVISYPVETLIPTAPPILPPNNPLRASINSGSYLGLYDKLIVNNMQPACPINLSDMIGACVAGWKRDGEWPVRPPVPINSTLTASNAAHKKRASVAGGTDHTSTAARRMSLTGLLTSRDRDADLRAGKGVRHSIQKVFGMGSPPMSSHRLDAPAATERAERAVPC